MRSLWTTDMPTYTVSGAGVLFQNKTWTNDSCSDKLEKREDEENRTRLTNNQRVY